MQLDREQIPKWILQLENYMPYGLISRWDRNHLLYAIKEVSRVQRKKRVRHRLFGDVMKNVLYLMLTTGKYIHPLKHARVRKNKYGDKFRIFPTMDEYIVEISRELMK